MLMLPLLQFNEELAFFFFLEDRYTDRFSKCCERCDGNNSNELHSFLLYCLIVQFILDIHSPSDLSVTIMKVTIMKGSCTSGGSVTRCSAGQKTVPAAQLVRAQKFREEL